jgi:hypothetical protein
MFSRTVANVGVWNFLIAGDGARLEVLRDVPLLAEGNDVVVEGLEIAVTNAGLCA